MVFKAQVVWYNAGDRQNELAGVFLFADSYSEALGKLAIYYGEDNINKVSIELFSPDDFLGFDMNDQDDKEKYREIEKKGEDICW